MIFIFCNILNKGEMQIRKSKVYKLLTVYTVNHSSLELSLAFLKIALKIFFTFKSSVLLTMSNLMEKTCT